jgi:hypothetical protein
MDKKLIKICKKCKLEKDLIFYHKDKSKKDGHRNSCKSCQKEYSDSFYLENKNRLCDYSNNYYKDVCNNLDYKFKRREYMSDYSSENKESIKEYNKKYNSDNREKISDNKKVYRENNKENIKKYKIDNKEKIRDYSLKYYYNRIETDNLFYLSFKIRNLIRISIKKRGYSKKTKTNEILGCSFIDFKKHLESKFEPWMTWDNHGIYSGVFNYGWDIDHIVPVSSAKTEEDVIRLNHYTNLQPLCSFINRVIKREKLIYG